MPIKSKQIFLFIQDKITNLAVPKSCVPGRGRLDPDDDGCVGGRLRQLLLPAAGHAPGLRRRHHPLRAAGSGCPAGQDHAHSIRGHKAPRPAHAPRQCPPCEPCVEHLKNQVCD